MVSQVNGTSEDNIQMMMAQMLQKINSADTDGITGLSKSELSSIDTSGNQGGTSFLKSLENQFDKLDTDGDGELSSEEISKAIPKREHMGPPPGLSLDASTSLTTSTTSTTSGTSDTSVSELFKEVMTSFEKSFINNFGNNSPQSSSDKVSDIASAADTDKSGGVSLSELSSLNINNTSEKGIVNDLVNNFKNYDTNGDGALSTTELSAAVSDKTGLGGDIGANGAEKLGNSLGRVSASFVQKLLNNYSNSFPGLNSSLNIAG